MRDGRSVVALRVIHLTAPRIASACSRSRRLSAQFFLKNHSRRRWCHTSCGHRESVLLLPTSKVTHLRRVLAHDGIDYMTTETDLRAVLQTAFEHCCVGGTAVFVPDVTTELYAPGCDVGRTDGDDVRSVRFMDWTHDPDSTDSWIATEYAFVLKSPSGSVTSVHETHRTGLFDRATWMRQLAGVGFDAHRIVEIPKPRHPPRARTCSSLVCRLVRSASCNCIFSVAPSPVRARQLN